MEPKAPLADCENCPLRDQPFVPSSGPNKVSLAIVGEAPGKEEAEQGIPFIGKSGQLLDRVLEYHGYKREEVFLTNACLCRPPDNATPSSKAIKACRPRLVQELLHREPTNILAVGATAAKSVRDTSEGINSLRAEPPTYSDELSARVVCTFHPAAVLYKEGYKLFPSILKDVEKTKRIEVGWEPTKYKVYARTEEAIHSLAAISRLPEVTLDVEVDYEQGWPNDPKNLAGLSEGFLSMAISHRPGASIVFTAEVCNDYRFVSVLDQLFVKGPRFGFQYGKFDIQRLWTLGAPHARIDEDTAYQHYSTDERVGTHDLEQMAVEVLGSPRYKTDTRQWLPHKGASLKHLPKPILYEYNAADADVTHRLMVHLRKDMASDGVTEMYHRFLVPGGNVLARVEYEGVSVDGDGLDNLADTFQSSLDTREAELKRWVDNPRSWQQVQAALKELGYDVADTTKETLKLIDEEFAQKELGYRKEQKLLSTYVNGLRKRLVQGKMYSSFNIQTTETGRLSSSNPNLQNIPIGSTIRDVFYAPEGYVFLSCDYAAIELRVLAILANDPYLLEAFRQGRNIHKETAPILFGPNYSEQEYVWTKNVRFGSVYQGTAAYLAGLYGVPPRVVEQIQAEMHRQSPTIRKYWRQIEREIREDGYLRSPTGHIRRFWYVTPENWKDVRKEGYAFKPQCVASNITLEALIKSEPVLRGKAAPIITVHDNLVFLTRIERLQEVASVVKATMESTGYNFLGLPTPVEMTVGKRWGKHQRECFYVGKECDHLKEYAA
jgi:uracil-DNA glycosylase family 4